MKPYIDYTLLKPEARRDDFLNLCREARKYPEIIRSVCVLPSPIIIQECLNILEGSNIFVCVVNDFPLGRGGEMAKSRQAEIVREAGAKEIDTVINVGALLDGKFNVVLDELKAVSEIFPKATKVILETGHEFYSEELIKKATEIVANSGAFCVKTSTGFIKNIPIEAKVNHIKWMHEAAPGLVKKVAGGIKTKKDAELFSGIVPEDLLIFGASSKFWIED
jgi:deoxyribose-phosphate aldolase